MKQNWYENTIEEVLNRLGTTTDGLPDDVVLHRQKQWGSNVLPVQSPDSLLRIFLRQFASPLVYVLLIVSIVVLLFGEYVDAGVIAAVLLINAIVGSIQEGRAQNTLAALKNFVHTQTLVRRGGKEELIDDEAVVPGDILLLREGDKVPADGRLVISNDLSVNESSLTGESGSVQKITEALKAPFKQRLYPPEQKNMLFKGTSVVSGHGEMVVTETGTRTNIGELSLTIAKTNTEIPLQANIRKLSRIIMFVVLTASVILFLVGILQGKEPIEMLKIVVSLAVSVIPEGLPIVLTLVLANGVWRMSQRKALIKKLAAVEALGQASVIAVDKTGTITKNELVVQKLSVGGKTFDINGSGYDPSGTVMLYQKTVSPLDIPELILAGRIGAYANAELFFVPETKSWRISGDPTEAALLVLSQKIGFKTEDLLARHPIVQEIPFDYHVKYRAVVYRDGSKMMAILIGAPETIARLSGISEEEIHHRIAPFVSDGLRVIAFAFAEVNQVIDPKKLPDLTFGGLYGMRDTMHDEVPEAVASVRSAGIRTIMITGDHTLTAQAIAKSAGIYRPGDEVLTGADLEAIKNDDELAQRLRTVSVLARMVPEFKLRVVQALQRHGNIVAMTGDGVNDVPSIVAADLGIAMGQAGTEVTKEAADIVLLDDNFSTIAAAVEEGRNIYKTVQRALLYLFSTSIGEFFTVAIALFIGLPLPVIAVQILWLNFVTDGFLTVAFAMEPKEEGLLNSQFTKPNHFLIDKSMIVRMVIMGAIMSFGTLYLFNIYKDGDYVKATTVAMTVLAVYQWFNAWNCRSETRSAFRHIFTNSYLILATVVVIALQFAALYVPFMQKVLRTTGLSANEWLIILGVASSIIFIEELRKYIIRHIKSKK